MEVVLAEAAKDELAALPKRIAEQVFKKIERLQSGLVGDIKALRRAKAGYRLRSGGYRILFDMHSDRIVIQHIKHRRDAYE
jgi:mRNA-degrading endonuclease RelE of RelBE toxin-antitoxin system